MKNPKKSTDYTMATMRFYWQRVRLYPKTLVGLFIAVPLTTLVNNFLPPLILATVLNRLSTHDFKPHDVWGSFGPSLVTYGVLVLLGGVVAWRIVDILVWSLEGKVERDIAQHVFDHLSSQSATFHADHFGGSLVSQTNKLMGSYIRFADATVFQVVPLVAGLIFTVIILAPRAPLFVGVLMLFAAFYIVSAFFVTRVVRRLGAAQAEAESVQTGLLADVVTNILTVKSFAGIAFENHRFAEATEETHHRLRAMMRGHQKQQMYFGTIISIISALSLTMAVVGVVTFNANLGTVFLILNYTATVASGLFTFSNNALRNYNRSLGDAAPMIEILQNEPEIKDPVKPEKVAISRGSIAFNDVTFRHGGADSPIFEAFDVHIKPGEKVGLVGHSGSGKTTFTRLLLRFSDIDSGTITIDGQNIASISQDDLRRHIAYVPQEPMLFHRSILENIRYGQPDASLETLHAVAKMAHADDFITDLPNGYETLVGERGIKLSGGQRQRIAIARAMLKNAPILVLDEATSALDSESEVLIQDALWKLMEGRTAIVIAHRLSTIQHMDRIIVLSDGHIDEQGSHAELLQRKGTYAKLWNHQSGGFIED